MSSYWHGFVIYGGICIVSPIMFHGIINNYVLSLAMWEARAGTARTLSSLLSCGGHQIITLVH
jgi:hypothetical protein